jgi:uncharacterized protein (UPF0297 family)
MEDSEIKNMIRNVCESLENKGYDSISQLSGFIISNDLGYIPEFDDNRNKMATLDRMLILEKMISEYLK